MSPKPSQRQYHFGKFKKDINNLSDTNGGIKLGNLPNFYCHVEFIQSFEKIEEALKVLDKSRIEVIDRFFDQNGWTLIDKWLRRASNQPSDKILTTSKSQKLIVKLISKWLKRPNHVLREETWKLIEQCKMDDEETRRMIEEIRSNLKNQTCFDQPKLPSTTKKPCQNFKSFTRTSEIFQQDENTPSTSKRPKTIISKVPPATPVGGNVPQPTTSRRSKGISQGNGGSSYCGNLSQEESDTEPMELSMAKTNAMSCKPYEKIINTSIKQGREMANDTLNALREQGIMNNSRPVNITINIHNHYAPMSNEN